MRTNLRKLNIKLTIHSFPISIRLRKKTFSLFSKWSPNCMYSKASRIIKTKMNLMIWAMRVEQPSFNTYISLLNTQITKNVLATATSMAKWIQRNLIDFLYQPELWRCSAFFQWTVISMKILFHNCIRIISDSLVLNEKLYPLIQFSISYFRSSFAFHFCVCRLPTYAEKWKAYLYHILLTSSLTNRTARNPRAVLIFSEDSINKPHSWYVLTYIQIAFICNSS